MSRPAIPESGELLCFEGFVVDPRRRTLATASGRPIPLMPKAFDTLLYLSLNPGRTLEKDELMRAVWPRAVVEENNLTQNISALRKALGERPGQHRFIVTVPGRGYRFVPAVERLTADSAEEVHPHQQEGGRAPAPKPTAMPVTRPAVDGGASVWRGMRRAVVALGLLVLLVVLIGGLVSGGDPPLRSVAVLPFQPLVAGSGDEIIELGMADSLITQLSKSDRLIVRPLSSTRRFTGADRDPLRAGRELEVDIVADGTVHVADDRLRVSTRVLRVADGRQLWAEQFDEPLGDVFLVQDSVARRVADALAVTLHPPVEGRRTASVEAYQLYMRGRLHGMRMVLPEVQRSIEYFERAILADPAYALPYVGIAEAQRMLVLSNDVPAAEVIPRAKIAAQRAVELDPDSPAAFYALGMIAFVYDWDWAEAERLLGTAVALGPNDAHAHIYYAHYLSNVGETARALHMASRARELDPSSLLIHALEGQFLAHHGQLDAAVARLSAAVEMGPDYWLAHHLLAAALIDQGSYDAAVEHALEAKRLSPRQTYSEAYRAVALARSGRRGEAQAVQNELLALAERRHVPPYHLAMISAALGQSDRAISFLEDGYRERDVRLAWLLVDPKWQSLRDDPRFGALLARMRFPAER